jgi:hypothetical protein
LLSLALSLAAPAEVESEATYQGKPLTAWIDAMRHDLDPGYRRTAMEAVARFGGLAIPPLSRMLNQSEDAESARAATIVLIRIGPAGRTVVAERLAMEPKRSLLPVIDGISQSGVWAHAFVPYLRTLANSPEVSLIALRTLAQAEASPDPAAPDPLVERQWDGPGGSIYLTPLDCFVKDRFSSVRAGVSIPDGARVKDVGMTFKSASNDEVFWTPAGLLSEDVPGRRQYEAILPKIVTLGLTAVSYSILVERSAGNVASEYVLAAISPTEEGCEMVGARAVPAANPTGSVEVLTFARRASRKSR